MKLLHEWFFHEDCKTYAVRTMPLHMLCAPDWWSVYYAERPVLDRKILRAEYIVAEFHVDPEDATAEEIALVKELCVLRVEQWRRSLP